MTDGQWAPLAPLLPAAGTTGGAGRVVGRAPGRDLLPGQRRDRLAGPCRPTSHRTRPSRPCSAGGLGRGRLHSAERARLADGRGPVPTAAVIDSRPSAPPTRSRPPAAGTTAGKKIKGPEAARGGRHRRAAAGGSGQDSLLAGPRPCVPNYRRPARGVLHDSAASCATMRPPATRVAMI
jgi:hypothetical protein